MDTATKQQGIILAALGSICVIASVFFTDGAPSFILAGISLILMLAASTKINEAREMKKHQRDHAQC